MEPLELPTRVPGYDAEESELVPLAPLAPKRPLWAEISAPALRSNYLHLLRQAQRFGAGIICVVKANAYGHGTFDCVRVLAGAGADWFAVTSVDEGVELVRKLRQGGLQAGRVLVLSGVYSMEDAVSAVRYGLTPVLLSLEQVEWLAEAAHREGAPNERYRIHLELDTGMARNGIRWDDVGQMDAIAALLGGDAHASHPLAVEAVLTHFASPNDPSSPQTNQQLQLFSRALARLYSQGIRPGMIHAGNSVTLFDSSQAESLMEIAHTYGAQLMLRPGLSLYGYGVDEPGLAPVLAWKTRVVGLRELHAGDSVSYNATYYAMRPGVVATLAVGYADGYNRLLSNRGSVLIRGMRAPVVGLVTMDQVMVDVTQVEDAAVGDEVVLLGAQGGFSISPAQMATLTGTIPYEVLCGISARTARVLIDT